MSEHSGHRDRLRRRFLKEGLDNFTDIQVLELMLFYAIPRRDTNVIAHALLDHFGSLYRVLESSVEELKTVEGMGEGSALLLKLFHEAARYYQIDRALQEKLLPTLSACGEYMVPFFFGRQREAVFLLCLDAKCKVLCCHQVCEGSINSAGVSVRRIAEIALNARATTVVLAHNHPSGIALPSAEDVQTTYRVAAALRAIEVVLADHIIVADGDYVSMVQSGYKFD